MFFRLRIECTKSTVLYQFALVQIEHQMIGWFSYNARYSCRRLILSLIYDLIFNLWSVVLSLLRMTEFRSDLIESMVLVVPMKSEYLR